MTLGNMRANGVRSLDVCCWQCHHRAFLSADPWPDHVPVNDPKAQELATAHEKLAEAIQKHLDEQVPPLAPQ
jgi:hypothetical protein